MGKDVSQKLLKVIQIDEDQIQQHLAEFFRGTLEETLIKLLDAEAELLGYFRGILKTELLYHEHYKGRWDMLHSIFEYLEAFYNQQRSNSTFRYL